MRRRSRAGARKEKIIMALSSVFVLAALTATGLMIREKNEDKSDGYVVDFSSIENNGTELSQGNLENSQEIAGAQQKDVKGIMDDAVTSDDLDYDPYYQETDSLSVESEVGETEKKEESGDGDKEKAAKDKEKDKEKNEKGQEGMIDESKDKASAEEESMLEEVAAMEEMVSGV